MSDVVNAELTEDEREQLIPLARVADWGGLRDHNSDNLPAEVTVSYPNGIQRTPLSARTFRVFSELFDRLTVGAPAPAPTREQIAALLADFRGWNFEKLDRWSDDRYGQKHYLKQADAILALFAKGDTPAPKHGRWCGYWLDLNCSCGLEGDTP